MSIERPDDDASSFIILLCMVDHREIGKCVSPGLGTTLPARNGNRNVLCLMLKWPGMCRPPWRSRPTPCIGSCATVLGVHELPYKDVALLTTVALLLLVLLSAPTRDKRYERHLQTRSTTGKPRGVGTRS